MDTISTSFLEHPVAFIFVVGIVGLLVGSFLNVVIYRLPIMLERQWHQYCEEVLREGQTEGQETAFDQPAFNLSVPRSHCSHCKRMVRSWENIPVLSYLFLKGKCPGCHNKISIRYPLVEILTALLSMVVAWQFGFGWMALGGLLLTWALIALAFIDYDTQLLPDVITIPLIWLGLLFSLAYVFVSPEVSIIGAVAGYLSLWSVYFVFKLATGKEGMGFGDFKLLSALGAWLGWELLPVVILLSSLAGAVLGLSMIALKKHNHDKPIPFGPYLAIAGWLAMLWGESMIDFYLSVSGL